MRPLLATILGRTNPGIRSTIRHFSSRRAVIYSGTGDPANVLSVSKVSPLPDLVPPEHVGIKFLLSPINPADLNVVQGVYPSKPTIRDDLGTPSPAFIGGNEGVGQIERVGSGVTELTIGDWVVMTKPQSGTWASHAYVKSKDVTKVDKRVGETRAATITVNPPTARGMLSDFRTLEAGDYVIQNGANSAVGQAVIQIAAARNLRTVNIIRDRPNVDDLKQYLLSLGATHVITEQELIDDSMRTKGIKLGLNCVGGKPTTILAKHVGHNAALVSYGAMSKGPLSLPTSLFIFKNLTSYGYETHTPEERRSMLQEITDLMLADKLKAPEHEILTIPESDGEATQALRDKLKQIDTGRRASPDTRAAIRHYSSRRAVIYSDNGDPTQVLSISKHLASGLAMHADTIQGKGTIGTGGRVVGVLGGRDAEPGCHRGRATERAGWAAKPDRTHITCIYPSKPTIRDDLGTPSPAFIGGNEGVAQVEGVGSGVTGLTIGDWVVMTKPQLGTWTSHAYVEPKDVTLVDKRVGETKAATITVNPPTARRMLSDFKTLEEGDYVIQNGANSTVGQAVIQIAAARNLRTINVIRDRADINELKRYLISLGATHVITEEELMDKSTRARVEEWTQGKDIKLGLNCVGGTTTTNLAQLLGSDAVLVSYGVMSKDPLSLPTGLFIFKNLTACGYSQTQWYATHTLEERRSMLQEITDLMLADKLKAPNHEILTIPDSDEEATQLLREKLKQIDAGGYGRRVLLKFN